MKIKFFRSVGTEQAWELNLIGKVWNLRIGRVQFALWRNYKPIFNFGGYYLDKSDCTNHPLG